MKIIVSSFIATYLFITSIVISLTPFSFNLLYRVFIHLQSPQINVSLVRLTHALIVDQINSTEFIWLTTLYTPNELGHLIDVVNLAQYTYLVWLVTTLLMMLLFFKPYNWPRLIRHAIIGNLCLVASLGIVGTVAWNTSFIFFHQLLFEPGTWEFPANSLLITHFPVILWQLVASGFLFTFCLVNIFCLIATHYLKKYRSTHLTN